jgi:hypothetical protein
MVQVQLEKPKLEKPNQFKIGIVGADGLNKAWTPEREEKAKIEIRAILQTAIAGNIYTAQKDVQFPYKPIPDLNGEIVVVSGHCPIGEERCYDLHCERFLFKHEVPIHQNMLHRMIKVYDKGGVDTLVEIIASQLDVKTEIYPAEVNQWEDKTIWKCLECGEIRNDGASAGAHDRLVHRGKVFETRLKGFRSRNIDMVNAIPNPPNGVLYDIEPKGSCKHCGGRGERGLIYDVPKDDFYVSRPKICSFCKGTGNYSGGTWTYRKALEMKKEAYQVIIE